MFIIFALSVAMEQTYDTAYAPAASAPAPAPSPAPSPAPAPAPAFAAYAFASAPAAYAPPASAPASAPAPAIKCTYNHNCDCRDCCEEFDYEYSQRNNRANYNVSTNYVINK